MDRPASSVGKFLDKPHIKDPRAKVAFATISASRRPNTSVRCPTIGCAAETLINFVVAIQERFVKELNEVDIVQVAQQSWSRLHSS